MDTINYNIIKAAYESAGYPFYEGKLNVNIFGIRNSYSQIDEFDDIIGIIYLDELNQETLLLFKGTTKPGLFYLKDALGGKGGTFILREGYYPGCWKMGMHSGKYNALIQAKFGLFKGWRDNNSNGVIDRDGKLYDNVTGLNLHTTSFISYVQTVGQYSAGCQVVKDDMDFMAMRAIVYRSMEIYGDRISYALFNKSDIT